jgi:hypothetical protein
MIGRMIILAVQVTRNSHLVAETRDRDTHYLTLSPSLLFLISKTSSFTYYNVCNVIIFLLLSLRLTDFGFTDSLSFSLGILFLNTPTTKDTMYISSKILTCDWI